LEDDIQVSTLEQEDVIAYPDMDTVLFWKNEIKRMILSKFVFTKEDDLEESLLGLRENESHMIELFQRLKGNLHVTFKKKDDCMEIFGKEEDDSETLPIGPLKIKHIFPIFTVFGTTIFD
jgi:hypothetical protein